MKAQVIYRISGNAKAVKKAVEALQVTQQAGGKIVRSYTDPRFSPPEPLPADADVIIIVTEVTP